tara:strand:+ start:238 stop:558 length:321 start_codon:yes stop_codon:yes gene_type:complete
MNDFLSFRAMISPTLVKIVFWIGTIISFLAGAWTLSNQGPFSSTGGSVVIFLTFFVVYPIGLRVWCELTLIVFQIHSTLVDIRRNTAPAEAKKKEIAAKLRKFKKS